MAGGLTMLANFIDGQWQVPAGSRLLTVHNPATDAAIAAPMAFFPFSGFKDSFFGDLHAQGRHGVEFYTQTKVVVERWPREWSRKF